MELNSVNRKQSDIVVNLPRDLIELGNAHPPDNQRENFARPHECAGHLQESANGARQLALDPSSPLLPRSDVTLQKELSAPGESTIGTILQAPGVMRSPEHSITAAEAWPVLEQALVTALAELIKMREREGKHLAKDLIHRLKVLRKEIKEVRALYPEVVKKYRTALLERIEKAGLNLPIEDERLLKEVTFFADRSDISEELTRLESHLSQFAHHLRRTSGVRTLES